MSNDKLIYEIEIEQRKLQKQLDKVEKEFNNTFGNIDNKGKNSIKKVNTELNKTNEIMQKIGAGATAFFGANLIKKTISGLVSVNKQMFDMGVKAQGIKLAFEKINGSDLEKLRKATKGTVSDLTLMQNAVKGVNLGLDVKEMGSLFAFAQQRARETGESVDYLVESITTGIGRKSPLILDNLGISAIALKEALGGVSMESASVADMTKAVSKIAQESIKSSADMSKTMTVTLDKIGSLWENAKLQGGEMLLNNKDIQKTLDDIFNLINANKDWVVKWVTDWASGVAVLTKTVAESVDWWAKLFNMQEKTQKQEQLKKVSDLSDAIRRQKKYIDDLGKSALSNAKIEQQKAKAKLKSMQDELKYQQMLLNNIIQLGIAEDKLKKAKSSKTTTTSNIPITSTTSNIEPKKIAETFIAGNATQDVYSSSWDMKNFIDNLRASVYNKTENNEQNNNEKKDIDLTYKHYDNIENIIRSSQNSILDINNFMAKKTIETFTKMSSNLTYSFKDIATNLGQMGIKSGKGGLFAQGSNFLGMLGVAGAGLSLVSSIFSMFNKDENETTTADTNTSSSQRANIVSSGAENVYVTNNISINNSGWIGQDSLEEYVYNEVAPILSEASAGVL